LLLLKLLLLWLVERLLLLLHLLLARVEELEELVHRNHFLWVRHIALLGVVHFVVVATCCRS
jgi:hypothetical protein